MGRIDSQRQVKTIKVNMNIQENKSENMPVVTSNKSRDEDES